MATCSICCETFNKTTRKAVQCGCCDLECCQACQKRYILGGTIDAHCMSCRRGYTRETLTTMFSKAFVAHEYKNHLENILFEREKCLLPASQLDIEKEKRIDSLQEMLRDLRGQKKEKKSSFSETTKKEQKVLLKETIKKLEEDIRAVTLEILELKGNAKEIRHVEIVVVKKCPSAECRGFLNREWACGLCNTQVCQKCHAVLGNEHTCKPEDVATAKMLAKETKDCPACGTSIFKISGCDQMWCTQCHTAFSWKTLKIEKGVIHNPHFYEFQRQANGGVAPRVPGDVPANCENLPELYICRAAWNTLQFSRNDVDFLMNLHRSINHIRFAILNIRDAADVDNNDLRKEYLKNKIDENTFKVKIQRREKRRMLKAECRQVLEMFTTCAQDLMFKSVRENVIGEMKQLVSYFNETMRKINVIYHCHTHMIGESGNFID